MPKPQFATYRLINLHKQRKQRKPTYHLIKLTFATSQKHAILS